MAPDSGLRTTPGGGTLLERLQHLEKVLHDREGLVEVVQQGSPLGVLLRAAEALGGGLDGVLFDEQQIEVRGLELPLQAGTDGKDRVFEHHGRQAWHTLSPGVAAQQMLRRRRPRRC